MPIDIYTPEERAKINESLEEDRLAWAEAIRRSIKESHMSYNLRRNAVHRWRYPKEMKDVEGEIVEDVKLLEDKR